MKEHLRERMTHRQKLSSEEKAILNAFKSGKLRSIPKVAIEKKRFQNIAKAHGIKNRRVVTS